MTRARRESGFAMLLVFAMAAAVAILLYTEMPRVAFEAQRGREQMLIDRGEQYQRAIQLFVRKHQRYPARIEDLENTNNVRFLRRKYPDPMTGKDEWRLIRVGPGGVLLDSKVQKQNPQDKDKEKKAENTFISEALPVGSTALTLPGQAGSGPQSPALARRASDRAPVSAASMGGAPGVGVMAADVNAPQQVPPYQQVSPYPQQTATGGYPGAPPAPGQTNPYFPGGQPYQPQGAQPGQYPGVQPGAAYGVQPGQYPGVQPGAYQALQPGQLPPGLTAAVYGVQPGQNPGVQPGAYQNPQQGQFPVGQPGVFPAGQPGQFPVGQPGAYPGMQQGQFPAGQPGAFPGMQPGQYPNPPASSQTGGQVPVPFGGIPQPAGGSQPGATNPNPALDLIRNLLTSPRQGGPIGTSAQSSGNQIGGGIAGVATKYEAEGIKVYNERTAYDEWEFIYDMKNDRSLVGGTGMAQGTQGMQGMQGMQGQMGTSSFQQQQMQQQQMQQQQMQQGLPQSPMTNPGFGPGRAR